MTELDLQLLLNLPEHCVFGFINDSSKEFYISYTSNLRTRIGAILTENENVLKEGTRLVVFFDGIEDVEYKRIFAQYYVDRYLNEGYNNLGSGAYINNVIKIRYSCQLDEVVVFLENKRKDKKVLGLFHTIKEAEEFVSQYYSNGPVQPIYAIQGKKYGWVYKHTRDSKPKN